MSSHLLSHAFAIHHLESHGKGKDSPGTNSRMPSHSLLGMRMLDLEDRKMMDSMSSTINRVNEKSRTKESYTLH